MAEEIDQDFVDGFRAKLQDGYEAEGLRIYQHLVSAVALEIAFKNRLMLMGLTPNTRDFDDTLDKMKKDFLDSWRKKINEVHEKQGKHSLVAVGNNVRVKAADIVDVDSIFDEASSRVERTIRINLAMPPRPEDLEKFFDFGNTEDPQ